MNSAAYNKLNSKFIRIILQSVTDKKVILNNLKIQFNGIAN